MKKISVDYTKIYHMESQVNKIVVTPHVLEDYTVLEIVLCSRYKPEEEIGDKYLRKVVKLLKKNIRKYDMKNSVFYMDKDIEMLFGKENMGFLARKEELFSNRYEICKALRDYKEQERKSVLMVLDEDILNVRELELLLLTIKDFFEDITIYCETEKNDINRVRRFLYEGWGVCVNRVLELRETKTYDAAFFSISDWKKEYGKCGVKKAYLLSKKENLSTELYKGNHGVTRIFSGMEYIYKNKTIPYQMAVDCLYQKGENHKIKPTSVAICEMK